MLLQVEQLNKAFGGLKAVNNVNFSIQSGEIVGLIGPNGSGKTTTLNLLTGFLKPDSGSIIFDGMEIAGNPRCSMCGNGIARTFQLIKPFLNLNGAAAPVDKRSQPRNSRFRCGPFAALQTSWKTAHASPGTVAATSPRC